MSDNFKDRQKAQEAHFAQKQTADFKTQARRNYLLGLWAAEQMALEQEQHETYAKSVVEADFEEVGEEDVFRKIRKDFDKANLTITDQEIRVEMARFLAEAAK